MLTRKGDDLPVAINHISQLLQTPIQKHASNYEAHSRYYMSAVLAYLNNAPIAGAVDKAKAKAETLLLVGSNPSME
jgi:hypothetical protein